MKTLFKIIAFVCGVALCFGLGFAWRDLQRGKIPTGRTVSRLVGSTNDDSSLSSDLVFKKNYQRILADYYRPLKTNELKYAGISGLVASLGDPHTIFMPPKAAEQFSEETKANFVGVGSRLNPDPLGAKVYTVFDDGPAYAAGLRENDLIVAVDGKPISGKDIQAIVDLIRGKENTQVRLTVVRGTSKPMVLAIQRKRIITPTVEAKFLPKDKVGIVTVSSFSEPTALQFDRALQKLDTDGIEGLVIDLRSNPGGLLETAVDMLSRFFENKVVVTMKFRDGHTEVAKTYGGYKRNWNIPIVVLVNEDSASAAEIFTGALRDYKLATIVGEHSYGKASVQNVFPLVDNSSAKITIAHYYLPSGQDISRKVDEDGQFVSGGIDPNVLVKFNEDDEKAKFGDPDKDAQLKRAIEVLKGKR